MRKPPEQSSDDGKQYSVGYGRPPQSTRFKKGRSGNPMGRPKGSRNVQKLFTKLLFRKVPIRENGVVRKVPFLEALAMKGFSESLRRGAKPLREVCDLFVSLGLITHEHLKEPVFPQHRTVTVKIIESRHRPYEQTVDTGDSVSPVDSGVRKVSESGKGE